MAAVTGLILGILATAAALIPATRVVALPLAVAGLVLACDALDRLYDTAMLAHLAAISLPLNGAAAAIATIHVTT